MLYDAIKMCLGLIKSLPVTPLFQKEYFLDTIYFLGCHLLYKGQIKDFIKIYGLF